MSEAPHEPRRQFKIQWLMVAILIAAIGFTLARAARNRLVDDAVSAILLVAAYAGLSYFSGLALLALIIRRRSSEPSDSRFADSTAIMILSVFVGCCLLFAMWLLTSDG